MTAAESGAAFALSEIEAACGVTLDDVRRVRARALVMRNGSRVMIEDAAPPALAGAAARLALGGPVRFVGFNVNGRVFERAAS